MSGGSAPVARRGARSRLRVLAVIVVGRGCNLVAVILGWGTRGVPQAATYECFPEYSNVDDTGHEGAAPIRLGRTGPAGAARRARVARGRERIAAGIVRLEGGLAQAGACWTEISGVPALPIPGPGAPTGPAPPVPG